MPTEEFPMMLRVRVSRLDDYTGELTQELEKLEIERDRGVLDLKQQADFLLDLRKAMDTRDLLPMRNKAILDLGLAALIALLAVLLPRVLKLSHPMLFALIALSALSLGMAAWRFNLYLRRRRHDLTWLGTLERTVAAGGTLFD
jgi:hypothetical protein